MYFFFINIEQLWCSVFGCLIYGFALHDLVQHVFGQILLKFVLVVMFDDVVLILFTDEGIMIETERIGPGAGLALVQGVNLSTDQSHDLVLALRGRLCKIIICKSGMKLASIVIVPFVLFI